MPYNRNSGTLTVNPSLYSSSIITEQHRNSNNNGSIQIGGGSTTISALGPITGSLYDFTPTNDPTITVRNSNLPTHLNANIGGVAGQLGGLTSNESELIFLGAVSQPLTPVEPAALTDNSFFYTFETGENGEVIVTSLDDEKLPDIAPEDITHQGTDQGENLRGSREDDVILAGSGNDNVRAGRGDDLVLGGAGSDRLYGQNGDDRLHGEEGNDYLFGNSGDDSLYGMSGDDYLFGGRGNDIVVGGAGNDYLAGQRGDDRLFGGAGNDRMRGGRGDDNLAGGDGDDIMHGGRGSDRFDGGAGDDRLYGGNGNDVFYVHHFTFALESTGSWDNGDFSVVSTVDAMDQEHDVIDGGRDHDSVSVFGGVEFYDVLSYDNGVLEILNTENGSTLTLRRVEEIQFQDMDVLDISSASAIDDFIDFLNAPSDIA